MKISGQRVVQTINKLFFPELGPYPPTAAQSIRNMFTCIAAMFKIAVFFVVLALVLVLMSELVEYLIT